MRLRYNGQLIGTAVWEETTNSDTNKFFGHSGLFLFVHTLNTIQEEVRKLTIKLTLDNFEILTIFNTDSKCWLARSQRIDQPNVHKYIFEEIYESNRNPFQTLFFLFLGRTLNSALNQGK